MIERCVKRYSLLIWAIGCGLWAVSISSPSRADTDVGNIAVIEADPTILQPGELFDLNNQTLTFTPPAGGGYTVSVGALSFDMNLGANLNLGDDGSFQQNLSFNFAFFGVNRTSVFINANGNLTFSSGSALTHFNAGGTVSSLGTDVADVLVRIGAGQSWFWRRGLCKFSFGSAHRYLAERAPFRHRHDSYLPGDIV